MLPLIGSVYISLGFSLVHFGGKFYFEQDAKMVENGTDFTFIFLNYGISG